MRLIHIFGTRPQFIKVAMVARAWQGKSDQIFIHTGQHYDRNLSDIFIEKLDLPQPDINLAIGSASHAIQTSQMMVGIEKAILQYEPDCVFVYGDTNSTLAGALVTTKMKPILVHVEAGLRSFNRSMPEEINRLVTDHVSDFLFCPTPQALTNLKRENIGKWAYVNGDVMADALVYYRDHVLLEEVLEKYQINPQGFCLLTLHRPTNVDSKENLTAIFSTFAKFDHKIIFPMHPRTREMIAQFNLVLPHQIQVIPPVGYLEMLALEKNARCVLTDSGGIQKEAYLMGTPCITLREETEWVETVQSGWNVLVGADGEKIYAAYQSFHPTSARRSIFGDYHAAEKIVTKTLAWMETYGKQ
ncbi:MAG: UDP-N-acetylglucosamine 2-epimerase (non-hydrolyzing) [Chloroflexi bacterium]|nr:UDP-N-acetylglucosamine 2-epimerase (non-hydrolyzing) [Chloroflexota bacterium]